MRYKTILFDADGTLFDFHRSEACAIRSAMSSFGIEPDDEKVRVYSEINDGLWKMLERGEIEKSVLLYRRFELFCEYYGFERDAREMAKVYMESLSENAHLFDGATELCEKLHSEGCEKVILGCTELSLIKKENPLPKYVIDSLEVLCISALLRCNKTPVGFDGDLLKFYLTEKGI